jgi:hypothetical protein
MKTVSSTDGAVFYFILKLNNGGNILLYRTKSTMKIFIIITVVLAVIFIIAQAFVMSSTNKTESHAYTVVKDFGSFEIRQYEPALFTSVAMQAASYKSVSSQGFRTLAGYIFGDNDRSQKIAMTSPVAMTMDDSVTMRFKVPEGMAMDDLPKPNNRKIRFEEQPAKTMAAIQFGGWSTDERIAEYTEKLKALLAENNIPYTGEFNYFGYNPPYELVNRKNEIAVEVVLQ